MSYRKAFGRLIWVAAHLFGINCLAHQNPCGDICPRVLVRDGHFVVYCVNNEGRKGDPKLYVNGMFRDPDRVVEQTFNMDGRPVNKRHVSARFDPEDPAYSWRIGDFIYDRESSVSVVTDSGRLDLAFCRKHGDTFFVFGHMGRDLEPFVLTTQALETVELRAKDHTSYQRRVRAGKVQALPDHKTSGGVLWDAQITHDTVVLLVREFDKTNFGDGAKLALHTYSRPLATAPARTAIGGASHIYGKPVCSELVRWRDHCLVAWLETEPAGATYDLTTGSRLFLSALDLKDQNLRTATIATNVHWNTSISMAVLQDKALVAYHRGNLSAWGSDGGRKSVIERVFLDLGRLGMDTKPQR